MYSHLASNDQTGPLDFVDPNGWFRATRRRADRRLMERPTARTARPRGSRSRPMPARSASTASPGRSRTARRRPTPPRRSISPVSANGLYRGRGERRGRQRLLPHPPVELRQRLRQRHQADGGRGVRQRHPIDLLSPIAKQRIDGTKFGDTIVLNDMGSHRLQQQRQGQRHRRRRRRPDVWRQGQRLPSPATAARTSSTATTATTASMAAATTTSCTAAPSKDTAYGGDGQDAIYGEWQDDLLYGDADNDRLYGGDDNDEPLWRRRPGQALRRQRQ